MPAAAFLSSNCSVLSVISSCRYVATSGHISHPVAICADLQSSRQRGGCRTDRRCIVGGRCDGRRRRRSTTLSDVTPPAQSWKRNSSGKSVSASLGRARADATRRSILRASERKPALPHDHRRGPDVERLVWRDSAASLAAPLQLSALVSDPGHNALVQEGIDGILASGDAVNHLQQFAHALLERDQREEARRALDAAGRADRTIESRSPRRWSWRRCSPPSSAARRRRPFSTRRFDWRSR